MDAVYRVILKADLQQLKILEQRFEETANDLTLFQPTEMMEIHQMEMDVVQLVALKPGGPALVEHHLRQIREVKIEVMGNDLTLYQRIETTEIHQTETDAAQLEVSKLGLLDLMDPQQLLMFEVKLEVMEKYSGTQSSSPTM